MTISISNSTVKNSAPSGTIIGGLAVYDASGTVMNAPPPPSGPAAEWTLTQASVSGTTVADASGNGNSGTVINGPLTFGAMGANFNGQQYVDSTLTGTPSALTVAVWFNAANLSNANPRLVANSHTDVDAKGFQLMFNSGGASGFFDVGNGTAEGRASWSQQLVEGTWYHYVGVYNGATVSAYLNGVQVASAAFAGGAIAAGTGPDINIARNPTYAGDYFIGAIYDVRIYGQALSAAEILALYQAVTPPPPSGPAAEWTLTQASVSGTTVADASGNGNSGTVINGPLTFGAMGANFNGQQYVDFDADGDPVGADGRGLVQRRQPQQRQPAARRQFPHRCRRQGLPTHVQQRRRVRFLRCRQRHRRGPRILVAAAR